MTLIFIQVLTQNFFIIDQVTFKMSHNSFSKCFVNFQNYQESGWNQNTGLWISMNIQQISHYGGPHCELHHRLTGRGSELKGAQLSHWSEFGFKKKSYAENVFLQLLCPCHPRWAFGWDFFFFSLTLEMVFSRLQIKHL